MVYCLSQKINVFLGSDVMIKKLWKKWFSFRGIYFYKNFKYIPKFIGEFVFFIKNGYTYDATYNHFDWFIEMESKILNDLIKNSNEYPSEFTKYNTTECPDAGYEEWIKIIKKMVHCLDKMDENNDEYLNMPINKESWKKQDDSMREAKEEFFNLFNEYFYSMWD